MSGHTPGPWEAQDLRAGWEVVGGPKAITVAETFGDTRAQQEANARLISSAPDLLEALVVLVEHVDERAHDSERAVIERARAAIAKAVGAS